MGTYYGTREVANKFIKYYHSKNLTIPIHWYINYEADLNYFTDDDGIEITDKYTWYLMQVIEDMTQISLNNGLNQPQFLWSPYFGRRIRDLNGPTIDKLTARIRSILQNVPKLGWLISKTASGQTPRNFQTVILLIVLLLKMQSNTFTGSLSQPTMEVIS